MNFTFSGDQRMFGEFANLHDRVFDVLFANFNRHFGDFRTMETNWRGV